MPAFEPFAVAARIGAKYHLSESQEQVLRATLAGLPDDAAVRFENRRRSIETIRKHRRQIFERMGILDRLHCYWIAWREGKQRRAELKRRAHLEIDELERIHRRGGR